METARIEPGSSTKIFTVSGIADGWNADALTWQADAPGTVSSVMYALRGLADDVVITIDETGMTVHVQRRCITISEPGKPAVKSTLDETASEALGFGNFDGVQAIVRDLIAAADRLGNDVPPPPAPPAAPAGEPPVESLTPAPVVAYTIEPVAPSEAPGI